MKKMLNTLYVTVPDAYLSKDGENVVVSIENEKKMRIPIHNLDGIVCFGHVLCTPALLGLCASRNVSVTFLSMYGRFMARVQGPVSGNVLLRREQYRLADNPDFCTEISSGIIFAKIANSRNVLLRTARDYPDDRSSDILRGSAGQLRRIMQKIKVCADSEAVRGAEGQAANAYFGMFDNMIRAQKEDFFFSKRSRRPPLDNVNSLLSFIYTLLVHDIVSALESVGLDPAVGFFHRDRPGKPSLALDIMEEFRPAFADRLVLTIINRSQLTSRNFKKTESGAVLISDKGRKTILQTYQKRKQDKVMHPYLDEKVQIGLLPFAQAMLLARSIRGDIDAYPPFIWK